MSSRQISAFERVRDLCSSLRSETKITSRRRVGDELHTVLSDPKYQARLARETDHDARKIGSVWRLAVSNAVIAAQRTMDGKPKVTAQDVLLPWKLVTLADKDSSQFHRGIFGDVVDGGIGSGAASAAGSGADGLVGGGSGGGGSGGGGITSLADPRSKTKLLAGDIQKLLQFCLLALGDDSVREVAEADLLGMLLSLCSRPDYVTHFHPDKDVEYILSEVETRLVGGGQGGRHPTASYLRVVDNSSKVFANLIYQLTASLGIGMHMHLASCFELVVKWCRSASALGQSRQAANETSMPFVYSAATNLLVTHSEQCVPLMRQHGRHLLALAKKSFPYSTGQTRDALIDYFSAHILVCEVAGRMQGLLPGDLGDLGRASLSSSQIETLLTLIASQKQLEQDVFAESSTRGDNTATRKRKRHSAGSKYRKGVEWVPLSRRQRRHLELCARLMYCAQRYWTARAEVAAIDNPAKLLVFEEEEEVEDGCGATREGIASDSFDCPFVSHIASRLCADRFLPKARDRPASTGSLTFTQSDFTQSGSRIGEGNSTEALEAFVCDIASLPMVSSIAEASQSGKGRYVATPSSTLAYLRLLSACADTYPSGECWSLETQWREDEDVDIALTQRRYEKIASPTETASVVFIVLTTLISSGGPAGDHDVQMWALLCLLKLTRPSFRAYRHSKASRKSSRLLAEAWVDVYNTLLRSDLKYASYTSNAFEGSLGEMVLMLLTEIFSLGLTDPNLPLGEDLPRAFSKSSPTITPSGPVVTNQSKVWSLPVFRDAKSVLSRAPFELISQILRRAGLSDLGNDTIDRTAVANVETLMEAFDVQASPEAHLSTVPKGRRYRLMAYCLRFFQDVMQLRVEKAQRDILPLACECLTVLIGRNQTNFPTSFSFGSTFKYKVVDTPTTWGVKESDFSSDEALAALWKDQIFPLRIQDLVQEANGSFSVLSVRQNSCCRQSATHEGMQDDGVGVLQTLLSQSVNAVSPLVAKALRETSMEYLKRCVAQMLESTQLHEDDVNGLGDKAHNGGKERSFVLIVTKVFISIALADDDAPSCSDNLDRIRSEICESVDASLKLLPDQSNHDFDATLIDLLGIFRSLLNLSSFGCASIIRTYGESAKLFYELCYRYLELYAVRSDEVMIATTSPKSQGRSATAKTSINFDSDSEEECLVLETSNSGDRIGSNIDSDESSDDEHLRLRGDKRRKTDGAVAIPRSAHVSRNRPVENRSDSTHARGAWLCAAAMTVLDPSLECYKSVTDCLVWPDNLDHEAKNGQMYTVDRTDALVCLALFAKSDALLREKITRSDEQETSMNQGDEETVVSICVDIIETIRSTADTASMLHLCGFSTAGSLIQLRDACNVSDRDTNALIDVLHPDAGKTGDKDALKRARRTLKRRPRVKVQQMIAVIRSFLRGGDVFHSVFDGAYAAAFVIPGICHIDSHVREVATEAVAAALKVLPNQRPIVNSVIRVLAPLPLTDDEGHIARKFDRWLKERFNLTENDNPKEWRAFHDAQESLESCSIRCRGVIAASTSDENIVRENILYLIRLSLERSDLLMPCYRACEQAAVARGYSKLENLFAQEREFLFLEFWAMGIQLSCIPLLVSSPPTVRFLLRIVPSQALPWQQQQQEQQRQQTGTATGTDHVEATSLSIDFDRLEEDSASQFALANASSLIPLIVLESSKFKAGDENFEEKEIESGWSDSAFKYLEDASVMIAGGKSDGDISNLLKTHLQDIYALFVPILEDDPEEDSETCLYEDEEEEEERQSTRDLLRKKAFYSLGCLKLVISEEITTRQAAKVCHLVVREILRLQGRQISFGKHRLPSSCFLSAIRHVAGNLSTAKEKDGGGGLFESAGSSTTECILDSKRWLDKAMTQAQVRNSWKVVECVCDQSCKEIEKTKDQMGFVIHVLLGILLESRYETLRPSVLSTLQDITSAMMSENSSIQWSDPQIASTMNELLLALVHTHGECQEKLLRNCLGDWRKEQKEARRSMGLMHVQHRRGNEGGDVWGWDEDSPPNPEELSPSSMGLSETSSALGKADTGQHSHHVDTMVKVYDLIEFLLLKSPSKADAALTMVDPLPNSSLGQNEMRALSTKNYKYSLQALLLRFEERRGCSKKELSSSDAELELKRFLSSFRRHRYASAESGTLNMHLRSLVGGLIRLEKVIRISLQGMDPSEISYGSLLHKTIQGLFTVCHPNYPDDIRLAASRCIGELSTFDLTSVRSFSMKDETDEEQHEKHGHANPLHAMQLSLLRLLANYFKSSKSETAIIAKDTCKWVLRTREGMKSWKRIEDDDTKFVLGPLLMSNKRFSKSDAPGLDVKFRERLYKKSGREGDEGSRGEAWCWSKNLWMCLEGGDTSYTDWIKDLVCAIILCCYSREGRKQSASEAKSSQGDDKSVYFHCLLPMCAREAEFAAAMFPGIIFDLLSSDTGKGKSHSKDSVRSEVAVGVSDSKTNSILTRCFSYLISPSASLLDSIPAHQNTNIETDTKALCLAVDTLDSLRRVVQSRWLASSNHNRNITEFPRTKADSGKKLAKRKRASASRDGLADSEYTAGLPKTHEWRGVPYGIVLHLPGLEVASACLRANRFASALFYSEMFADNHLGGSGRVLERLAREKDSRSRDGASSFDISGFGLQRDDSIANDEVALSLSSITMTCLGKFGESDGLDGVRTLDTAIRFYHNAENASSLQNSEGSATSDWERLLVLDTQQQMPHTSTYSSNSLAITTQLKSLGLRHVLRNYMLGLQGHDQTQSHAVIPQDQEKLKDKWFEESWRTLQWDDSLLSPESDTVSTTLTAGAHSRGLSDPGVGARGTVAVESGWNDNATSCRGMNESLYQSLTSALNEESDGYSEYISEARRALLDEMCSTVGKESLVGALPDFSTKLRGLNQLQDIKDGFFLKSHPMPRVLAVLRNEQVEDNTGGETSAPGLLGSRLNVGFPPHVGFQSQEFLMSVQEVALRVCSKKRPDDTNSIHCALADHLLDFSDLARQRGRPETAGACLARLSGMLEICGPCFGTRTSKLHSFLRLHLEDAKLNGAKGNFSAAIRTGKLVLTRLQQGDEKDLATSDDERNCLISDASALCGELMVDYKVESGKNILRDYLGPASSYALRIYENNNSTSNGLRVSQSEFALAEFVASLHDNVQQKVSSQEWINAGVASEERRAELQLCNKMLEKANKENNRGKASKNRSGQTAQSKKQTEEKTKKEYRELMSHVATLRRELKMDEKERTAVEKSGSEYLHLALRSYGRALSIFNPSTMAGDVSRHIFRMISLWFSNSSTSSVNDLMRQCQGTIPTHHFVPLAYQIFARLSAESESGQNDFQSTLRSLILKMCKEHPFHCLIQLITLANGNKVDADDASGASNSYLQYNSIKSDASKSILHSLKQLSGAFEYVSNLVDSYTAIASGYIDLAMFPTTKFHEKKHANKKIALSAIKTGGNDGGRRRSELPLDRILGSGGRKAFKNAPCVLTKPPMIRPACDYGNGASDPIGSELINTFDPNFAITDTGIHRPKIVRCIGSKGGSFKQLVKGEDDIRQDAIMQQVFSTVNDLLRRPFSDSTLPSQNMSSSRSPQNQLSRRLNLVTYNIVPLSPVSGVLEWVDDTMPFGEYLNDRGKSKDGKDSAHRVGAHSRYYPGEWGTKLCQIYFMDAPAQEKRQAFDEICKRFSPAFRYFFVERFSHSLQAWHVARTMYTRSCAVNSIVGHILGIGDRHCNNILVHQKTGEVVHIDFGIVFEQGKCLNTPETVPFRLTRDIVDGMGPSGTEGCFSVAAEATASVLRGNTETLLTILSAVVSDPLYKWSINPLQARRVQRGDQDDSNEGDEAGGDIDDEATRATIGRSTNSVKNAAAPSEQSENDAANRAIQKIRQKLQGFEEGNSGERQSVEGQVQLLINSARDRDNLCVLSMAGPLGYRVDSTNRHLMRLYLVVRK